VGPRAGLDYVEKILDPSGTGTPDSSVVEPLASRYTDCVVGLGNVFNLYLFSTYS
jgi:hypothetical protein